MRLKQKTPPAINGIEKLTNNLLLELFQNFSPFLFAFLNDKIKQVATAIMSTAKAIISKSPAYSTVTKNRCNLLL